MSALYWFLVMLSYAAVAAFLFRLTAAMWTSGGFDLLG